MSLPISPAPIPIVPLPGSTFPVELVTVDPVVGTPGPVGSSPPNWFQYNVLNGKLWACVNGAWAQINASSGGTVTSVTGGTGISVNNTDPNNPVVSAATPLTGSAALDFGTIPDGGITSLTFTLTGAAAANYLAPAWPVALPAGLVGTMYVSAANTVRVVLANLSGAPITTGSLTYGAKVV